MGKKLYVGNLDYTVDQAALLGLFSQCGAVTDAVVVNDRDTGRSKGFGFVEMSSDQEAQAAIDKFNGQEFSGRALTVNEARPRPERGPGGGGGSSRGGSGGGGGFGGGRRRF
jgi:RNA recognition motif-containing protein